MLYICFPLFSWSSPSPLFSLCLFCTTLSLSYYWLFPHSRSSAPKCNWRYQWHVLRMHTCGFCYVHARTPCHCTRRFIYFATTECNAYAYGKRLCTLYNVKRALSTSLLRNVKHALHSMCICCIGMNGCMLDLMRQFTCALTVQVTLLVNWEMKRVWT